MNPLLPLIKANLLPPTLKSGGLLLLQTIHLSNDYNITRYGPEN